MEANIILRQRSKSERRMKRKGDVKEDKARGTEIVRIGRIRATKRI